MSFLGELTVRSIIYLRHLLNFKGKKAIRVFTALPAELPRTSPGAGIEPAARSNAYLRHLNFFKKG